MNREARLDDPETASGERKTKLRERGGLLPRKSRVNMGVKEKKGSWREFVNWGASQNGPGNCSYLRGYRKDKRRNRKRKFLSSSGLHFKQGGVGRGSEGNQKVGSLGETLVLRGGR